MAEGAQAAQSPAAAHVPSWLTADFEAERERWFLWTPVLFALGIAGYMQLAREPAVALLAAIVLAAWAMFALTRRRLWVAALTSAGLLIALGALAAKLRTDWVAAPLLQRQLGQVVVTGFVERAEPRTTRGQRLTIRVIDLGGLPEAERPVRVRLTTRGVHAAIAPGVAVRVQATLGPPPQPTAPGDFDFGRLAWFSGLGGIGFASATPEIIDAPRPLPWDLRLAVPIERLRQGIRERIVAALPGETGEIATALITGERGGISEATNQAYRDSGLFHILSISGLHMVIMAGAVFWVLRLLLASVPAIALRYPIKTWAAAGAIVGAFAYLLISGAAVATVRSYVMITIMFIAVMLGRPALALRNVALAALLILVIMPESLFDAGFQMSFAAVVGLVAAYEALRERRRAPSRQTADERRGPLRYVLRFFGEIVASTVIASLAVAPFAIYHFHNTQLLAVVANLVAIPVCNIVVMPAALAVLVALPFGLEAIPLAVMGAGIDAMTAAARVVGALPGAVVKVPAIPTASFVAIIVGGLWLLLWRRRWRLLGTFPIALGLALAPTLRKPDLYVGRDGVTIAVRASDGRLSALTSRGSAFDLGRWLELDGDGRSSVDTADARAFRCDAVGCTASVRGRLVAVAVSPAALRDDCPAADILILRVPMPRACAGGRKAGQIVIDPRHLARAGAHAIYIEGGDARVETVADHRGRRPWSGPLVGRDDEPGEPAQRPNRLAGFAGLFERFRPPRPEHDDAAWPKAIPDDGP